MAFLRGLDKRMVSCFYDSQVYKLSRHTFFNLKGIFTRAGENSALIKGLRNAFKGIKISDAGLFIMLVTVFNTLYMRFFCFEIDVFGLCARAAFIVFGIVLLLGGLLAKM